MANRWKGNFVVAANVTSSGTAYTGKANGAWGLNSQLQQKQGGLWAKGQTVPNAPTGVTATRAYGEAIVYFTAPTETGGLPIISYTVTSPTGNIAVTGASSPITIPALIDGTSYTFTVTARNNNGASESSNSVTPLEAPSVIGQAYGGGFYAGKIAVGGGGVATHYLIVAPKATGENSSRKWGTFNVTSGITSVINGPTNSASLAALGAAYQAASFCENLNIGTYSDWYLPAKNELEVLYYFLKPGTTGNNTSFGSNASAVSPEPISTNYGDTPIRTSVLNFRTGGSDALTADNYWSSSEANSTDAFCKEFGYGSEAAFGKNNDFYVRAVRRIAI